jgi:isoquinoline 1-oxidoreductase beta subunit
MTFLGGGFGRKSVPDYVVEAALLAKQLRVPVRVQWTREDDLRHDYYHAPSVQLLTAGLDASNKLVGWRHRCSYPSIGWTFDGKSDRPGDGELGLGVLDLPLAIPNVLVEACEAPANVRIGWLRSVANIQQAFAVQSFIAELAHELKRDPKDVLLEVLGDSKDPITIASQGVAKLSNYGTPLEKHPISRDRFRGVIEAVTKAARWSERGAQKDRGFGLAVHRSFLSYIAVVAAVIKDANGKLRLDEVWLAADCGTVINTERVRSQLEGAVIFGQSIAFHSEITMRKGAVVQGNFHEHKLARIPEAPRAVHIELIRNTLPPGGVGEPGVPPVAPAITNAVFALTGTRHRVLPMRG